MKIDTEKGGIIRGDVVAYTSDHQSYAKGVGGATQIPLARNDGRSYGFDHERLGVLNVDPELPGGFSIDFSGVSNKKELAPVLRSAVDKAGMEDPYEAWKAVKESLGMWKPKDPQPPKADKRPQETKNELPPIPGYTIPRADSDGNQIMPAQDFPVQPVQAQTQAQPVAVEPTPARVEGQNDRMDSIEKQLLRMGQMVSQLNQIMTPASTQPATVPQPAANSEQLIDKSSAEPPARTGTGDLVEVGKLLKLPFDLHPSGTKPKFQVYFDLGGGGTISAYYHHVSLQEDSIFLYYDVRFEFGQQYVPPDREEPLTLQIPALKKEVRAFYRGQSDSFGVFDVYVLIIDKKT